MKVNEILNNCFKDLSLLDKEVILAFLINKDRIYLLTRSEDEVDEEVEIKFFHLCKERKDGVPLAYLVKSKEFYGLNFFVDERVLIPRSETEFLVSEAIKIAENDLRDVSRVRILDLGTGSGCIAVSLAKNLPDCEIIASDISREVLEVVKINLNKNCVQDRIRVAQSNVLEAFKVEKFDIVVTNPPYIGLESFDFVEENVRRYEPEIALFSGKDGLDFYRNFFDQLFEYKISSKFIVGEFGDGQARDLKRIVDEYFPEVDFRIGKDYSGKERWFVLRH